MSKSNFVLMLSTPLTAQQRFQVLLENLSQLFTCSALVLLKLDHQTLKPVAAQGLADEALGRRFIVAQHPRLTAIVNSLSALRFPADSALPDPYDGLLSEYPDTALPMHDCMGIALWVNKKCWGALTLDSLTPGAFGKESLALLEELRSSIEANLHLADLEDEVKSLKRLRLDSQPFSFANMPPQEIIGKSSQIMQIKKELAVVARSDLPALIMGETGVGKEVFANYLHRHSHRADKSLIHINCAALPEHLAESELFGHVKGAFTGATSDRAGRFESAHLGTIFLDEVGELPLSIQAKLLRVLQNGEIQRLGSDKVLYVDVRIIAATNRNLKQQITDNSFRADLFHRLSVYPITIPPLRERRSDIALLSGYFLELNRSRLGVRSLRLAKDAELALEAYSWPGNVRELEHAISRAAIKALNHNTDQNDIITLTAELLGLEGTTSTVIEKETVQPQLNPELLNQLNNLQGLTMKEAMLLFQKYLVTTELAQHNGSWSAAARALGIDPSNLHKLAQKLGLK